MNRLRGTVACAGLRCDPTPSGIGNFPSEMDEALPLLADTTRLQTLRMAEDLVERQAQSGFDFSRNASALQSIPDSAEAEATLLAQLHGSGLRSGLAPSGIGNFPSEMDEALPLLADTTRLQTLRMAEDLVERQAQSGFDFSRNGSTLQSIPDSAEAEPTLLAQLHGSGLRSGPAPRGVGNRTRMLIGSHQPCVLEVIHA